MTQRIPRLRMFAGPNGSGKSVLKSYLPRPLLGVYVNADELEAQVNKTGKLDLADFHVKAEPSEVLTFFRSARLLQEQGLMESVSRLRYADGMLDLSALQMNSYFAAAAADFIRQKLLQARVSFTFETVMSHPSKVDVLAQAQQAGYRTYLYYVATDDPTINSSRVQSRVRLGGHDVREDLIHARYHRSLALLLTAIRHTNRAYIFDNSGDNHDHEQTWLAEITEGKELELKTDLVPAWFKRTVLDQFEPASEPEDG